MTNKMTPHDKIKAALEFYVSPYTYQKDMKTGIKDIQNDNGVKADSALALLETHKLVPKDVVVVDRVEYDEMTEKLSLEIKTLRAKADLIRMRNPNGELNEVALDYKLSALKLQTRLLDPLLTQAMEKNDG